MESESPINNVQSEEKTQLISEFAQLHHDMDLIDMYKTKAQNIRAEIRTGKPPEFVNRIPMLNVAPMIGYIAFRGKAFVLRKWARHLEDRAYDIHNHYRSALDED